jgi:hypothetical protein
MKETGMVGPGKLNVGQGTASGLAEYPLQELHEEYWAEFVVKP